MFIGLSVFFYFRLSNIPVFGMLTDTICSITAS